MVQKDVLYLRVNKTLVSRVESLLCFLEILVTRIWNWKLIGFNTILQ